MQVNRLGSEVEHVCGIPVHCLPHAQVLAEMNHNIASDRERRHIAITNTESMFHARRLPAHRKFIEEAHFSLCDGMGVVVGGMLQGRRITRFNGPVLMLEACQYGVDHGWRHFFCGGREGVARQLSANLERQFPGLITAGTWCPPFQEHSADDETLMLQAIEQARPDVVWVGLGLLRQENWIARYKHKLDVPWMIGVGAAFDFHAGTARWAPAWIRKLGMEWLYRLCFEPRMLKRNYWSFIFLLETTIQAMTGKAPLFRVGYNSAPNRRPTAGHDESPG